MAKKKNSVQSLIDFERFTRSIVKTDKAEIAFFYVTLVRLEILYKYLLTLSSSLSADTIQNCS